MATWEGVRALRLARGYLDQRAPRGDLVRVVSEVCGLHAQVASAAELQAWARVEDVRPDDVREALWERRSLVRTWLMRGTLHLVPAADLPVYVAALSTNDRWWKGAFLRYVDLTAEELRAALEAIRASLGARPLTRERLAVKVGERMGERVADRLRSNWGELLKPAAFHGFLCSGPPRGQQVTFVRPERWLGGWEEHDPARAIEEVLRRFLRAYGPATRESFARWWGDRPAPAGRVLEAIAGETIEVDVEGTPGRVLAGDDQALEGAAPTGSVRLLPGFDPYVMGFHPREHLVPPEHSARVFRQAGWVTPTLLVDGRVEGVWGLDRVGGRIEVTVEPWGRLPAAVRRTVGEEVDLLGRFLDAPAALSLA